MTQSVAYLADGMVVGYRFHGETWKHIEGEETEIEVPYIPERPLPIEILIYTGTEVISLSSEEVKLKTKIDAGQEVRDAIALRNITVHTKVWGMTGADRDNIQDAIDEAALYNLPDDTIQNWVLADDSTYPATPLLLKQVLSAYRQRKKKIFDAYITWLKSGDDGVFTYVDDVSNYSFAI